MNDLVKILNEANANYCDGGLISELVDEDGEEREQEASGSGDTLAVFIESEIRSVFDPSVSLEANRANVAWAILIAVKQMDRLVATFSRPPKEKARP